MRPGQEESWFGSDLPGDAAEAADQDQPPGGTSPAARPAIQRPPPRRIQHPLPASLPRPLTEPAPPEPAPPEPPAPAPPAPAPPAPAASEPAPPAADAALPTLPTRRRPADRPAPAARYVTLGTPLWAGRPEKPVPAPQPPAATPSPPAPPEPAAPARPAVPAEPAATPPDPPGLPRRLRRRVPLALSGLVLAAAVTAAAVTLARPAPRPARAAAGRTEAPATVTAAARARDQAAAWISAQVSRAAIVACDPAMCAALQSAGLPAPDLLVLGTGTPDPLGADLVVATPAVRSQFGARLAGVYAPVVLARFGSGPAGIDVRVIAPGGAPAYRELLARDAQARRHVAAQLLANPGVRLTPAARAQLLAGDVDSRLLLLLPALAAVHPVRVLAFADAGPGADPAVPLRAARLAAAAPPGLTQPSYVAWLRGYVRGQRPPYDGQTSVSGAVVTIQFSSPSPLGLLST